MVSALVVVFVPVRIAIVNEDFFTGVYCARCDDLDPLYIVCGAVVSFVPCRESCVDSSACLGTIIDVSAFEVAWMLGVEEFVVVYLDDVVALGFFIVITVEDVTTVPSNDIARLCLFL